MQIAAILDEVFRTYGEYIDSGGLSLDGLHRTYDDGAGDVDRDFDALGLSLLSTDDVKVSASHPKCAPNGGLVCSSPCRTSKRSPIQRHKASVQHALLTASTVQKTAPVRRVFPLFGCD